MCAVSGIDYEVTDSLERLRVCDYDIVWLPAQWIPPQVFPPHVKLLYGPQHFVFPENHPICGPRDEEQSKRAVYTCLSPWVKELWSEFTNESVVPFEPLPLGVELKTKRNLEGLPFRVLVYGKHRHPAQKEFVREVLKSRGIPFDYFEYGSYIDSDYQSAIQKAHFCIWIGCHESQGFAFQECLAQNVPILCMSATTMFDECDDFTGRSYYLQEHGGKRQLRATTTSWWSEECGIRITSLEEFEEALETMQTKYREFTPRAFIERELSDEVCMQRILNCLRLEGEHKNHRLARDPSS